MGLIREHILEKIKLGIITEHPDMSMEQINEAFNEAVRKVEQEIEDNLKKTMDNHEFFKELD